MRKPVMKKDSGWQRWLLPVLFGAAMGLLVTSAILTVLSLILTLQDIPQGIIQPLAIVSMAVGALVSGYLAARIVGKRGLLCGLLSGTVCCLILLVLSLAITDVSTDITQGVQLILALAASAFGGVMGVGSRNKRRA